MIVLADPPPASGRRPLLGLAALGLGAVAGWSLSRCLAPAPSAVLVSLLLAGGAALAGAPQLSPLRLRLLIGAASGSLVGTAQVLAERAHELIPADQLPLRLVTVLLLALAGGIAGLCLGRDADRADRRHPRDLLRGASALTTGLFALVVTLTFLHQGLEGARALSSRLSTTLTIVVTAVVVPGWLCQQLRRRPLASTRHRQALR
jgi:hypothetical protein